ncbi:alpha/beta hydrolase [Winogradskyella aurantiaca]|uniref:alpha/beta hydrolase n=1 Tax=Winogradskyella aurantiaca TaxID=2219558 RepID=UPI000E1D357F|nr:alpha/beta fold hydrolase [Winogradskyella aurantiaca]
MQFVLDHLQRPSTLSDNAPLLIMCHGYGSDENDLFSFASELPDELFIISLKAPYPLQPYGNAWYAINFDAEQGKWSNNEQAIKSRDLIAQFIDQACEFYPINSDNITLLGFSQGTILSLAVALSYPQLIKNVVGLSGYVNPDIINVSDSINHYEHLQVYSSHGSADQVIPVEWARKTPNFLNKLSIKNEYKEYPVGHGVAPQNFFDFKNWLLSRI